VQNRLSARLLSKDENIQIYKTIILPVVLYGRKSWFVTLMEEHRLNGYDNRVLGRIFGPSGRGIISMYEVLINNS
jgi:hypothetical protein